MANDDNDEKLCNLSSIPLINRQQWTASSFDPLEGLGPPGVPGDAPSGRIAGVEIGRRSQSRLRERTLREMFPGQMPATALLPSLCVATERCSARESVEDGFRVPRLIWCK